MAPRLEADRDGGGTASGYFTVQSLARHTGLSVRTLRSHLHAAVHPLPHFRVGGRILIARADFERWLEGFRAAPPERFDVVVADLLKGL